MNASFLKVKDFILDLLFPKFCASCRTEGSFLCENCSKSLIFLAPSCFVCGKRNFNGKTCPACSEKTAIRRFFAPFAYKEKIIRETIHLYKYGGAKELAGILGGFISEMLEFYEFKPRPAMIFIPIPLHKRRMRERGFNQSQLIAQFLSERFRLTIETNTLLRIKNTAPQIEMKNSKERRRNMAGAFRVTKAKIVRGKIVILIDDVSTSGATIEEAARVLKEAGAKSVWAAAVARR